MKRSDIPIHIIANELSPSVCECLPAVQLIWGGGDTCDTTCSVNRKGTRPTLNWLHI